ncbi:amidohydrolase family protein [Catenovulum sediminis]|uniref:Amidohydrolase family protein n=1 Tax=Catenovulum sediminis TaxID=1740262 RepID=A0ABV1RLR9_9ALTE
MHDLDKIKLRIILLLFFAFIFKTTAEPIAIKAGHLIDPQTGQVFKSKIILVEGDRVSEIVDSLPEDLSHKVIDLSDFWLMPGLIDMHTHITYSTPPNLYHAPPDATYLQQSTAYRALKGLKNAQDMQKAGFTTLRDLGNNANYADTALVQAINANLAQGPRIINAGKIITVTGGQSHNISPEAGQPWEYEFITANTPAQIIESIRQNVFYGAQVIKLVVGDHNYQYSEEDIRVFVDEAKAMRQPLTVAAHAVSDLAIQKAVRAGVDTIEHGYEISEASLKLMAQHGTTLVTTEATLEVVSVLSGHNPAAIEGFKIWQKEHMQRFELIKKHQVKVAFGSDMYFDFTDNDRGRVAKNSVYVYQSAGLSPLYILQMMTVNAAAALQLPKQLGQIKSGFYADIIATKNNPLDNIKALDDIRFVMQSGVVVENKN